MRKLNGIPRSSQWEQSWVCFGGFRMSAVPSPSPSCASLRPPWSAGGLSSPPKRVHHTVHVPDVSRTAPEANLCCASRAISMSCRSASRLSPPLLNPVEAPISTSQRMLRRVQSETLSRLSVATPKVSAPPRDLLALVNSELPSRQPSVRETRANGLTMHAVCPAFAPRHLRPDSMRRSRPQSPALPLVSAVSANPRCRSSRSQGSSNAPVKGGKLRNPLSEVTDADTPLPPRRAEPSGWHEPYLIELQKRKLEVDGPTLRPPLQQDPLQQDPLQQDPLHQPPAAAAAAQPPRMPPELAAAQIPSTVRAAAVHEESPAAAAE